MSQPEKLFDTDGYEVEEVMEHPAEIVKLADQLHDRGLVEEADQLLDASATLVDLFDKFTILVT